MSFGTEEKVLQQNDFSVVKSPHTDSIIKLAADQAASTSSLGSLNAGELIKIDCILTPGNDLYIGIKQYLEINASLHDVESVLLDVDHYKDLFPGYKNTKITAREGNTLMTFWEQTVPVFFVPNVKYEMVYQLEQPSPQKRLFKYQLHKTGQLKVDDGFILISQVNDHLTQYLEYDFFDAEWGLAKVAGKTKIWSDSVEGMVQSDLAIKSKAENPTWKNDQARSEGKKRTDSKMIEACVKNKSIQAGL